MTIYYAVCNVNGPISRRIEADSDQEAVEAFEHADHQAWLDEPATDAEDNLDIPGDGMSEDQFAEALEDAGCRVVCDLAEVVMGQAVIVPRHIVNGWMLWVAE